MTLILTSTLSNPSPFLSNSYLPLKHPHRRRNLVTASSRSTSTFASENGRNLDYYKILCLNNNCADLGEIKQAYRRMALKHHPDVCGDSMKEESTRFFVQLSVAYKTLSDPLLRREYDSDLRGPRERWREQIEELKRRSCFSMMKEEGSWGARMRAQKMFFEH